MLKNSNIHGVLSVLGSIPVELREESLLGVSEAFSHLYPPNKYIEFGQTFEYNIERTFKYVVTPFIIIVHFALKNDLIL